jgi:hypothetical protein
MKELADAMVGLEVALRVDLGIYAVESWNIETGFGAYTDREMLPKSGGVSADI